MNAADATTAEAAIEAVLTRYFNLEIALVGGSGPELTVSRELLAAELAQAARGDGLREGAENERRRILSALDAVGADLALQCRLEELLDGAS